MPTLPLRDGHITLAQAVKAAGLADSGAHAKYLVRDGEVTVNGSVVTQPGRKLGPGDSFRLGTGDEWLVQAPDS
jgi:ribosome-associated protein